MYEELTIIKGAESARDRISQTDHAEQFVRGRIDYRNRV